ncbi:MAG: EAL domain-containing protein [Steroidobacteraceae bacterium]
MTSKMDSVPGAEIVLVVDDDDTTRLMISAVMSDAGYTVLSAIDGADALEKVAEHNVDCVVTDVMMPNVNGFDLCNMVRIMPDGDRIQVLFMTGLDDFESIQQAYSVGANDFAAKSIHPELLVQRVRFLLRNQQMQDALRQSEQRLKYAQRLASLGHWERTLDGQTKAISPVVCQFLDTDDPQQLTWDYLCERTHPDDLSLLQLSMQRATSRRTNFQLEHRFLSSRGVMRILRHQGEFNRDSNGDWLIYSTVQDVTENRAQEDRIRFLAFHDPLTELPNRAAATRSLARVIASQGAQQRLIAVFALSLDDFSRITSSLGQNASDTALKTVSERLRRQISDSDQIEINDTGEATDNFMVAHAEADKFICIVNNLQLADAAMSIVRRLQRALAAPMLLDDAELQLTASVGISLYPGDALAADKLIENAFTALSHTKDQKAACQMFAAEITDNARQRLSLETQLRQAVEKQEFELFFQPRLHLADNTIYSAEALARWRHPTRGIVSPGEFIPLLEEMDLIAPMGNLVISMAARQAARWHSVLDKDFRISFNISPLQFGVVDLVAKIDEAVAREGARYANLEVEVTESALMSNADLVIKTLHAFRERGLLLALDDFGTGFSSLGLLRDLPLDILKIDRSFVANIGVTQSGSALVNAILLMARALDLECAAEGVELESQLNFLTHNKCHEAQGFLMARPMAAVDCENWIKDWQAKNHHAAYG